jgi:hypothetical protein
MKAQALLCSRRLVIFVVCCLHGCVMCALNIVLGVRYVLLCYRISICYICCFFCFALLVFSKFKTRLARDGDDDADTMKICQGTKKEGGRQSTTHDGDALGIPQNPWSRE